MSDPRVLVVHNRYRLHGGEERAVDLQLEALERMRARNASYDPSALAARARERYGHEAVGRLWDELYDALRSAGSTSSATTRATASRR